MRLGEKDRPNPNRTARHDIIVHETPDPRTFGVECSCGERWFCFWGEPSVEFSIDKHYSRFGVTKVILF